MQAAPDTRVVPDSPDFAITNVGASGLALGLLLGVHK
jgi:hypothetical protein